MTVFRLSDPEIELLISYLSTSQYLPPALQDLRTRLQFVQTHEESSNPLPNLGEEAVLCVRNAVLTFETMGLCSKCWDRIQNDGVVIEMLVSRPKCSRPKRGVVFEKAGSRSKQWAHV